MTPMKKHHIILTLAILSFIVAIFDTTAGIYVAVLANVLANVIVLSRQRSKTTITKVKKERPLTVDEFRQREMRQHPYRPYPDYGDQEIYK
jgi:MFS superfamily sulfate permease-like transporter